MDDTFVAQGTADAPCIIEGHTFQVRAKNIRGSVAIIHCTVHQVGDRGKAAFDLELHGAGALRIEDSTFTQTGQLYVVAEDDADVSILRNDFQADSPVDYNFRDMLASEAAVKVAGMSSRTKLFQGNRILLSNLKMEKTQHWLVGGLTEAEGNILYGLRGGLWGDTLTDVRIAGNYMRTPAPYDGWNRLTTLQIDGASSGVIVEHNLIRGGSGLVFGAFAGELRYNILADPHAAFWINGVPSRTDLKIHHNLLLRSEATDVGLLYWRMLGLEVPHPSGDTTMVTDPKLEFFNNTMDTADCYNPPGAEDPGPARMLYADYNDFFNGHALAVDNYALSVAGKTERADDGFGAHDPGAPDLKNQQADPQFVGPQPIVFPFTDDDLSARKVTVCQVLAYYRKLYTPSDKSPLVDKGDPADGPGTDIGAIGAGAADPSDQFGLACPADVTALAAPKGDALKCVQAISPGGGGGGGTPTTAPGWLCVCTVASPPSLPGLIPLLALLAIALARRRRHHQRQV